MKGNNNLFFHDIFKVSPLDEFLLLLGQLSLETFV